MNEVIKNIVERRSIKKYKSDMVPTELIDEVLKAGTYAPSGMNRQSPMGVDIDPFYGAPVVLVVLADKSVPTYIYDGSLVMENMMLAASSLGLGSCWIHRAKEEEFETEEGKEILKSLGITGDYEGIGNCILGYPDMEAKEKPRKENYIYKID